MCGCRVQVNLFPVLEENIFGRYSVPDYVVFSYWSSKHLCNCCFELDLGGYNPVSFPGFLDTGLMMTQTKDTNKNQYLIG